MATKSTSNVIFSHLDLNTTPKTSQDGTLRKAHNLRYGRNGLQAQYGFGVEATISNTNNFTLVYSHQNRLLALHTDNSLHHVEVVDQKLVSKQQIAPRVAQSDLKIMHFGKSLFLTTTSSQKSYIYNNDSEYILFNPEALQPIDNPAVTYLYKKISDVVGSAVLYRCNDDQTSTSTPYLAAKNALEAQGYIMGAFYFLIAYELYDGTVIKNSPLYSGSVQSERYSHSGTFTYHYNWSESDGEGYDHVYESDLYGCKASVAFSIDSDLIGSEMIRAIVVYATRPTDIYDISNMHQTFMATSHTLTDNECTIEGSIFYSDGVKMVASQPLFEVYRCDLTEVESNIVSFQLNHTDHFENIIYQKLYSPSFSVHDTIHRQMAEYNGRLHTFNHQINLYSGSILNRNESQIYYNSKTYLRKSLSAPYSLEYSYTIEVLGTNRELPSIPYNYYYTESTLTNSTQWFIPVENFYCYPDIRCKRVDIWGVYGNKRKVLYSFDFTEAANCNMAYYQRLDGERFSGFTLMPIPTEVQITCFLPLNTTTSSSYATSNVIMVSNINNPYFFDPINNYTIENEECAIYHIATAADQVTENSFGKHPLIAFTSMGIYALEQGIGSVLYSNIAILDTSPQMPTVDSTVHRGLIFFTSNEGVMTISGREVKLISKALESSDIDDPSITSIIDYIEGSSIYTLLLYNEIMVYNPSFTFGYIFSLDYDSWSSRDLDIRELGTHLFLDGESKIVSIKVHEDRSRTLLPTMVSNPIKLGSYNFKKINYVEIHHTISSSGTLKSTLWGSNDLERWEVVGTSLFGQKLGRTSSSWRYFRVEISGSTPIDEQFYIYLWLAEIGYCTRYLGCLE